MKKLIMLFLLATNLSFADQLLLGAYGTHYKSELNKSYNNSNEFIGYEKELKNKDSIIIATFNNSFYDRCVSAGYNFKFRDDKKIRPLISLNLIYGYEEGSRGKVFYNDNNKLIYYYYENDSTQIKGTKFCIAPYVGFEYSLNKNIKLTTVFSAENLMILVGYKL